MRRILALAIMCSACTTVSVDDLDTGPCSDYVPPEMWAPTPHATPPGSSQASHGQFEVAEAGQLEKANADKSGTHHIITVCEQKKQQARQKAQHRLKPWYKRLLD